jgi:NADH-quinone oxidoreductase subunit M
MEFFLLLAVFLPLLGAIGLILAQREEHTFNRALSLATMGATLLVSIALYLFFDPATSGFQFEINQPWIQKKELGIHINFHFGADGISLLMLLLTALITPIAYYATTKSITDRFRLFSAMFLLVESGVMGMFVSQDLILFYVFWEAMLIPMYFLVGIWGTPQKGSQAAIKFFLYTMAGSVLMLIAMIATYMLSHPDPAARTFDLPGLLQNLKEHPIALSTQIWLFLGFAIAFAIKIPIFPFHNWLPEAYVEAPLGATMMMAAIFSKAGAYGLIRFGLPLFPVALQDASPWFLTFGVAGVIYGALIACVQQDMKRLIAFSSISHLGIIVLGLFAAGASAGAHQSLAGAALHMFNHGILIAALFLIVALLEKRFGTRMMKDYLGLMRAIPKFSFVFMLIMLASVALPGTNGFVGEFLILLGVFQAYPLAAVLGTSTAILSAIYMLWMYQKTMFESPIKLGADASKHELQRAELVLLAPVILFILWIGIYPNYFLERLTTAVNFILGGGN